MAQFHDQPHDLAATGFHFKDADEFLEKIGSITNDYGQPLEEFEIEIAARRPTYAIAI